MNKKKLKKQWLEVFGKSKDVSVDEVAEFLEKSDLDDLQLYYLSDTRGGYWYEWRVIPENYFHGMIEIAFALDYNFKLDVYNFESLWDELEEVIEEAEKTKKELNL